MNRRNTGSSDLGLYIKNVNIFQTCTYAYRLYSNCLCVEHFCVYEKLRATVTSREYSRDAGEKCSDNS